MRVVNCEFVTAVTNNVSNMNSDGREKNRN